jgi:DNA-binding NtrC family response regulator
MPDRLLVVDDEVEFAETLAERLRSRGLEVDVVHNGYDALTKVQERPYDALILDFAMPGMDGIETLKKLVAQTPDVQVMLLSGHATIKTAVEASKLGAIDILEKPTDIETILEKVRQARANRIGACEKRLQEDVDGILKRRGW